MQFIHILKMFGFHTVAAVRTLFPSALRSLIAPDVDIFIREHLYHFIKNPLEHLEGLVLARAKVAGNPPPAVMAKAGQFRICGQHLTGMPGKFYLRNDVNMPCGGIFNNLLHIGFGQIASGCERRAFL